MRRALSTLFALALALPAWAARDFDGTNDNVAFGTDPGIDNFGSRSYGLWIEWDGTGVADILVAKSSNNTTSNFTVFTNSTNVARLDYSWSGTMPARWLGSTSISGGGRFYVNVTYDNSLLTNDPIIRIDCIDDTVSESAVPLGTASADGANTLRLGESDAGAGDLDGRIGWFAYDNSLWDAATCNRARWWGRPFGSIEVYHPLVTDKLNNEGVSTANGTATGTTVTSLAAPVVRPGSAMLTGVGW